MFLSVEFHQTFRYRSAKSDPIALSPVRTQTQGERTCRSLRSSSRRQRCQVTLLPNVSTSSPNPNRLTGKLRYFALIQQEHLRKIFDMDVCYQWLLLQH